MASVTADQSLKEMWAVSLGSLLNWMAEFVVQLGWSCCHERNWKMSQHLVYKHSVVSRLQTLELCVGQWSLAWRRSAVPPPPDMKVSSHVM